MVSHEGVWHDMLWYQWHLEFGETHDDMDFHSSTKDGRIRGNKSQSFRVNETKARGFDHLLDGAHGLRPVAYHHG